MCGGKGGESAAKIPAEMRGETRMERRGQGRRIQDLWKKSIIRQESDGRRTPVSCSSLWKKGGGKTTIETRDWQNSPRVRRCSGGKKGTYAKRITV